VCRVVKHRTAPLAQVPNHLVMMIQRVNRIYIYTFIYLHIYMYTFLYICICVYIYTYYILYVFEQYSRTWHCSPCPGSESPGHQGSECYLIYVFIYIHKHMYIDIYMYIHMCICIYMYIYIHVILHIHTYSGNTVEHGTAPLAQVPDHLVNGE